MKTDSDLDRQVRRLLREGLNHEVGPDPTWAESPAARRVTELERRARQRWPLRVLAVAALIGAIGGAALLGGALDHDEVVFEVALHYYTAGVKVSSVVVRVPEPTPIHAQLPDGWVSTETGITNVPEEPDAPIAVSFWTVDAVFNDPCNAQGRADPPLVQSLGGLAEAFTHWWLPEAGDDVSASPPPNLPSATRAVHTTVSGFRARYLELRIPATVDMDRCGDRYVTWRNADDVERRHAPGDVSRLWIVEVGPDPSQGLPPNHMPLTSTPLLVIDATSNGEASPEALRELEELIDSVRIEAPERLR